MWFSRPVFHVADVAASVAFYERLGFTSPWRYENEVAQVERDECAIILSSQWPDKRGKGMIFVSLGEDQLVDALKAELGITKEAEWGYRCLVIDDPDGNQLYFNYPTAL